MYELQQEKSFQYKMSDILLFMYSEDVFVFWTEEAKYAYSAFSEVCWCPAMAPFTSDFEI